MATTSPSASESVASGVGIGVSGRAEVHIPVTDDAYVYKPLQPGQVRLLFLLPAATFSERVEIKIEAVNLEDIIDKFEALSYTWGIPDPPQQIFCDNQSITVTPNLYDALQVLRLYGATGVPRVFWIDQITINQADYAEKNEQVARMREIYTAAKYAIVWLSKEIWEEDGLADACMEFSKFCDSITMNDDILHPVSKTTWRAMFKVYGSTAYFRRVWILQEILCSKKSWFLIGRSAIIWDIINSIGSTLQSKIEKLPNVSLYMLDADFPAGFRASTRCFGKLSTIWTRLHGEGEGCWNQKWTLLDLIRKSWNFQSTETKDKVYAMVGVLNSSDHCVHRHIQPDYSPERTYASLVEQVFIWGYTEDGGLENLVYATTRVPQGIPSWMGGLATRFAMPWEWVIGTSWSAGGTKFAHVTTVPGLENALSFRATEIARLGRTSEIFLKSQEMEEGIAIGLNEDKFVHSFKIDFEEVADFVSTCWQQVDECFEHNEDLLMEFTKAFTLGTLEYKTSLDTDIVGASASDDLLKQEEYHTRTHMQVMLALIVKETERAFGFYNQIPHSRRKLFTGNWMRFSIARKKFASPNQESTDTTSEDSDDAQMRRIMCWAPPDAKPEDMICIIHGLRIPMVIREVEGYSDRYQFVGPCYVHGYMYGEAVSDDRFISKSLVIV